MHEQQKKTIFILSKIVIFSALKKSSKMSLFEFKPSLEFRLVAELLNESMKNLNQIANRLINKVHLDFAYSNKK